MLPIHKPLAYNIKRVPKDRNIQKGTGGRTLIPTTASEYMQYSSLLFLKHLQNPTFHPLIRLCWGLVFVLCSIGAVVSSVNSYYSYTDTPLVMSVETSSFHISNVHFPAVAICNVNKVLRTKALELARRLAQSSNYSEGTILNHLKHFGNMYNYRQSNEDIVQLHQILLELGQEDNITALLEELAPKCDSLLQLCTWKGVTAPCSQYFKPFLTITNGFCCVFNYNHTFDILFPEYYDSAISSEAVHVEYSTLGVYGGLSVELDLQVDEYFYAQLPTIAANVLVFAANSVQDSENGNSIENLVPLGSEVFLELDATVTYSDSRIEKWPPSKRNCDFSFEHKFTKGVYSYPTCLVACRVRNVTRTCGCLPLFMPRKSDEETIPFCNLSNLSCLNSHKRMWSQDPVGRSRENNCNCRPACNREQYTLNSWDSRLTTVSNLPSHLGLNRTQHSAKLHLFTTNAHTTKYSKDILMQESHLFSNLAGVCSLFLGCSFISLVEIPYFFVIRPLCNKYFLQEKLLK